MQSQAKYYYRTNEYVRVDHQHTKTFSDKLTITGMRSITGSTTTGQKDLQ